MFQPDAGDCPRIGDDGLDPDRDGGSEDIMGRVRLRAFAALASRAPRLFLPGMLVHSKLVPVSGNKFKNKFLNSKAQRQIGTRTWYQLPYRTWPGTGMTSTIPGSY